MGAIAISLFLHGTTAARSRVLLIHAFVRRSRESKSMRKLTSLLCALCTLLYPATRASAEDHTVLLLSQSDRTVYDMDPASGKVINQVQLGGAPTGAVFSFDEQSLFVSVPDQGYISIIDLHTFKEVSRLTKPEFKSASSSVAVPDALATTPDYQKLYVSVPGGLEVFNQQLLVENPEYKQPEEKISLPGKDGQYMLVHGPSNKLYYAFRKDNQVAVIDTKTDKVLKIIPVKGGPTDVTFVVGGEAWVTATDGSVSIIDTDKDEVVKTIETGGKGNGRITVAPDLRFIAATHEGSGTVSILQPMTKEVMSTVDIGKGLLSPIFAPAGGGVYHGYGNTENESQYPPTDQLYVAGQSGVSIVDLEKMTVSARQEVGKGDADALIHYTYPDAFVPPREGTATRILETDSFSLFNNAMFAYDFSGVHEHRTDMSAVVIGQGIEKIGCWTPDCPQRAIPTRGMGGPYEYHENDAGTYSGVPRGTLHEEEGISPSPRRMVIFMVKNNYYRQQHPKENSDFANKPGFKKLPGNTPRTWMYTLILNPGHPVHFPKTDYAFVYLGGGLIRETHAGVPEMVHRLYGDWEVDPTEKTVEAVSNPLSVVVVEFR
jgi:YVTN family beta-propeller protein